MARRSKDNRILIRVDADATKRLARNAAMEKAASDRTARRTEKKARTAQSSSMKEIGKRAAQIARRLARDRATQERRLAKRKEKEAQRDQDSDKPKRKRPFHPKGDGATEKYTSYARRLERSKKLKATRTSPTTFTCNGYTIKVTAGDKPSPISCTCADFTQVEGGKSWKGSNAGPFNPCKHMMAVCPSTKLSYNNVFLLGTAVTSAGLVLNPYKESRGTTTNPQSVTVTQGQVAGTFDGVTYYNFSANGQSTLSGFLPTPSLVFEPVFECI